MAVKIPWDKIAKVLTELIDSSGQPCNIYERQLITLPGGEQSEDLVLVKSDVKCIKLNNSGNTNIYSSGIVNNAVLINSSHLFFMKFEDFPEFEAFKHIMELKGKKYNIRFPNNLADMDFGWVLDCEVLKTGISQAEEEPAPEPPEGGGGNGG